MATEADDELIRAARRALANAYAPYSGFPVGAALRAGGRIFTGVNVENASYGATLCAERVAAGAAVAAGATDFAEMAVVVQADEPSVPCGCCRQVLAEFNPALVLVLVGAKRTRETTLAEFFGEPFVLPER